ncbi:hypothetical protein [Shimia sp. Alg240-R146]|uniref:hypothetical protein n=1 Tax=Shimia sp. Alg240-R146 TaxID=2993449 RepID=UPI0022E7BBCD|nr:hypothetical protein [Shimia sp. Alg240-R146]
MATCPCDTDPTSPCPDIPAGLTRLPLQDRGFAEVRRALLSSVARQPSLAGWSTDGQQDLGVMLLDMWAYVADVTRFYDAEIAGEFYLDTAQRDKTTKRITSLIGYKPRPALSAKADLVVEADGRSHVPMPARTGFRSEGFEDEPPQVFETLTRHVAQPARNIWHLDPIEADIYPGRILLRPKDNGVPKRGILAFRVGGVPTHASQIGGVSKFIGPDDRVFTEVTLETPFSPTDGTTLSDVQMRLMGLTASKSPLTHTFVANKLVLDGLYPQLKAMELAVLETPTGLYPFEISSVARQDLALAIASEPAITAPASEITHAGFAAGVLTEHTDYRVHFNPIRIGALRAPAKTEVTLQDLGGEASLKQPDVRLDQAEGGPFVVQGRNPTGESIDGEVMRDALRRDYSLLPNLSRPAFDAPLVAPLKVFGNVVTAVRGESVGGEVLGSADAARPDNRFQLKKAPLSWIEDPSQPNGLRPLIDVYVDGIRWNRAETLYTARPEDRVYVLEEADDGKTSVIFGDGLRGERPTTGVENVVADYRWGAGAAKPPPGTIKQMAKPVKGIRRVLNPLPATGGADAEAASEIRTNAPAKVLALGKAVSVQDFEALAAGYPGVLNTAAGWAWDATQQRAVVTVWVIEDGGLDHVALRDWLISMAADDTPVEVTIATGLEKWLLISVLVHPDHNSADTKAAVEARLADETLALSAVPIGGVLYRSALVKAIQTVPGVASVPSLRVDGSELDWAMSSSAGSYFDFSRRISVL